MGEVRNTTDQIATTLAERVIRLRWLVMIAAVLATIGMGFGMSKLTFASNYRVFFSDANPELSAWEEFQATYTRNDNILVVIAPKNGNVFTRETLDIVERTTEKAWQTPYVLRVDSITNFQHTYADGDELVVEDLVFDALSLSDQELDGIRNTALNEPLLRNQLVTPTAGATAINVVLQYPDESLTEVPEAVAFARAELRDAIRAETDELDVVLSGVSMLNNSFAESGQRDMSSIIPIMFLIVSIALVLALRSLSGAIVTLLVVFFSIPIAMGAGGFMGVALTPISIGASIIILTLAIADSVHVLMTARENRREGMSKHDALVDAVRTNFLAITITSLTTIIGFLALNFSDSPPFHHLGNITAVGIFAAWALSLTLLPAVASVLPMHVKPREAGDTRKSLMERFGEFVLSHYRLLAIGSGALAVGLIAFMPTMQFDDQWVEYFDEQLEVRTENDFALQHFGLYPIEYSLEAADAGGISDPAFLAKLEEFSEFLRAQPGVTHVYSVSDIMKRLNRNLNGDDPDFYRLPETRGLSAQYLLLYELSLPYGLDLNDRINIDKSATRLTATLTNVSTAETRAFLDTAEAWLAENALESMRTPDERITQATGPQVMFTFVAERNVQSMISGIILAVVAISLILIVTVRSLTIGVLSLIPNGLPILTAFGAWALLVGVVGFSVAAVSSVLLGIVVDDTVHFLTKYVRGIRERGLSREDAIRYAFRTVGAALFVNTAILAIGFAWLAGSTFKPNADMGLLTALGIVFALFLDFLLLPALLLVLPGIGRARRTHQRRL